MFLYVMASATHATSGTDTNNSFAKTLSAPPGLVYETGGEPTLPRSDPRRVTLLSAALPGLGQLHNGHPLRAASFFSSQIILGIFAFNRYDLSHNTMEQNALRQRQKASKYRDSLQLVPHNLALYQRYLEESIIQTNTYNLYRFQQRSIDAAVYHAIGWMSTVYLWNIIDAAGTTNFLSDYQQREPSKAVLLSLIPYLGLGQIYNGSLSKAGLIFASHTMLTYMAYNNNRFMDDCLDKIQEIKSIDSKSLSTSRKQSLLAEWNQEYGAANKKRNTYLWFFIMFYFYGIFDALVDAHLHDYPLKFQLDTQPEENTLSINISVTKSF